MHPIHDSGGKVRQFIAIETDITERKTNQQALLDSNENFQKINRELDRFVYSASHDLRAPISSLLGLIEVARLEKSPESMGPLFDMQKKSLQRMDRFIQDIVDYSRNARLQVESESINFEELIHAMFEQLQYMEHMNEIKKIISIQQRGEFYTAPSRLTLILNNLLSNAIKYADMRKPVPSLQVDVTADDKQAILRIIDNGEGIPSHAMTKIFEMFFRASANGSGSGLGLYIVKEALDKIGGTIDVKSEYGMGSEFTITIPNKKKL